MNTITIDRAVVEQSIASVEILNKGEWKQVTNLVNALRAAMEQPQVEQEPIAWANINKQGDITHTSNKKTTWAKTPLYTHPQNLNCKSTQHRLATLWGYEKPQPPRQPLTDGDTVPVPRSLLGAACSAINRKQDAPKVLEQLRRYTVGDLSKSALEQPTTGIPVSVPVGWKLVPMEPTQAMMDAGRDAHYEVERQIFAKRAVRAAHVFQAMLAAAPQPQVEQEPIRWPANASEVRAFLSGHVAAERYARDDHQPDDSDTYTLSAHDLLGAIYWWTDFDPQPPRQPLTDEQIADIEDMFSNEFGLEAKHAVDFARAIERAVWEKSNG